MKVQRVCLSEREPRDNYRQKCLVVLESSNVGVYTGKDTLYLKPFEKLQYRHKVEIVYIDEKGQHYSFMKIMSENGLIFFFTPLRPFKRKVYALTLSI